MKTTLLVLTVSIHLLHTTLGATTLTLGYSVFYRYMQAKYRFPPSVSVQLLETNGQLIPANIDISAVKFLRDGRIIVLTPRWMKGVPITLGYISSDPKNGIEGPVIRPYPNFWVQTTGDCDCHNSIQSVEDADLDTFGRLWLPDTGIVNSISSTPYHNCPAKLIMIDPSNHDQIQLMYEFPSSVVSPYQNELRAIKIACLNPDDKMDCMVYISNIGESTLVVFNYKLGTSWKIEASKLESDPQDEIFTMKGPHGGFNYFPYGIDGMVLSPDYNFIYFTKLGGTHLYRIPTAKINMRVKGDMLDDADITDLGFIGHTDGMALDCSGNLYYGFLTENEARTTKLSPKMKKIGPYTVLAQSDEDISWIDTFSFDSRGSVYFTADRYNLYASNALDPMDYNFRIVRLNVQNAYPYNYPNRTMCM